MDIDKLTPKEREELLRKLSEDKAKRAQEEKEAYEKIRAEFLGTVKDKVKQYMTYGTEFKKWLKGETEAFFEVMKKYGRLKRDDQMGFSVADDEFKYQVKANKVKGFDERADMAEKRLVDFLQEWIKNREDGTKNPMYKLAMLMIQRNENGDLDYKSISKLYELEDSFADPEYTEIMQLFKESNTVEGTVIHFYFEEKGAYDRWKKIEPSFNKI